MVTGSPVQDKERDEFSEAQRTSAGETVVKDVKTENSSVTWVESAEGNNEKDFVLRTD